MILPVTFYTIAAVLLAAHFLRAGVILAVVLCLAAPLLFLWRRRWTLPVLQVLACGAAVVWLVTAWQIAVERRAFGEPWLRAAAILFAVAAFSVLAGGLLRLPAVQNRYRGR